MRKGKRIEDLDFGTDLPPAPQDARDTVWSRTVDEITELRESGRFAFADDTLRGIAESIAQYRHVTEGQRRAIDNIAAARQRSDGWRRRRYEGWHEKGRY